MANDSRRRWRMSALYRGRSILRELSQLTLVRHCCRVRPDELEFAPCTVVDCRGGLMATTQHDDKGTGVPLRDAELRESERGLRAREERLHWLLEGAGLGHWDYDYGSDTLVWSEQTRRLLGVEPGEPASRVLLRSRMHAEDRLRFEEYVARRAYLDADHICNFEFRVVTPNGAIRWLEDQSRVETNATGMPVRAGGIVRDITARKNAEEVQAHLAAIVTSSADAIVGKTLNGIVTSWNEAAEGMFGYSAGEMIGQSIRRLIPADRQAEEDMILARLARSESIVHFETKRVTKDGRTFDASVTISPVRDAEGRVIGAAKIVRDISERKQAEQALQASKARLQFALDAARLGWG
jgi:PAS domain S-box-containing protein